MYIDPTGLAPTIVEAALMANHIYGDYDMGAGGFYDRSIGDWRLIEVRLGSESMKMGIYIKTDDTHDWKNPLEYALVFKGTDNFQNWINNAEAYLSSKSKDVWDAMDAGLDFVRGHANYEITFVGHSKGGGEAIAAAIYLDRSAITFNAANYAFEKYVSLDEVNNSKINNYYVCLW
jgi:hypothetical protein